VTSSNFSTVNGVSTTFSFRVVDYTLEINLIVLNSFSALLSLIIGAVSGVIGVVAFFVLRLEALQEVYRLKYKHKMPEVISGAKAKVGAKKNNEEENYVVKMEGGGSGKQEEDGGGAGGTTVEMKSLD